MLGIYEQGCDGCPLAFPNFVFRILNFNHLKSHVYPLEISNFNSLRACSFARILRILVWEHLENSKCCPQKIGIPNAHCQPSIHNAGILRILEDKSGFS